MTRAALRAKPKTMPSMAIYHFSVKAISRSAGRSAPACAAYRAACEITDERTGETHDYTRKEGVESATIVLPDDAPELALEWALDRAKLWNAAERAEKRKDACVAREFEVALPAELTALERERLALDFAKELANREGCAVDVAIHAPGRGGDNRNHHAHMLRTTRRIEAAGLGEKLDTEKAGRKRCDDLQTVRARWAELTNERLRESGIDARVDHRSLEAQGIEREPTKHLGPAACGYERRTGEPSSKRLDFEAEVTERLARAQEAGEIERQSHQLERSILDLSAQMEAATKERNQLQEIAVGMANFRANFEAKKQAELIRKEARDALIAKQASEQEQRRQEQQKREQLEKQQNEVKTQRRERDRGWSR